MDECHRNILHILFGEKWNMEHGMESYSDGLGKVWEKHKIDFLIRCKTDTPKHTHTHTCTILSLSLSLHYDEKGIGMSTIEKGFLGTAKFSSKSVLII